MTSIEGERVTSTEGDITCKHQSVARRNELVAVGTAPAGTADVDTDVDTDID